MATQQRNPTSDVAVTGTWDGSANSRYTLVDDHPDSSNPIADGLTCSGAGVIQFGFSPFAIPAGSTAISVQVLYYDFKNGSQTAANGASIRCNDTTNRNSSTHNPGNGNANIASRSINYATNPKTSAAWTVDDVNGIGTNGLTAFGINVSDASPSSTISSIQLQVTYTPPVFNGDAAPSLLKLAVAGSGTFTAGFTGAAAVTIPALLARSAAIFYHAAPIGNAAVNLPLRLRAFGQAWPGLPWNMGGWTQNDWTDVAYLDWTGTAATALKKLTFSATGSSTAPGFSGSAAITLKKVGASASGSHTAPTYAGSAATTLKKVTASASASHTPPTYSGSAVPSLRLLALAGAGTSTGPGNFEGAADVVLKQLAPSSSATFTVPTYSGSGSTTLTLLGISLSGSFAQGFNGAAAVNLPKLGSRNRGTFYYAVAAGTVALTLRPRLRAWGYTTPAPVWITGGWSLDGWADVAIRNVSGSASVTLGRLSASATGAFTTVGNFIGSAAIGLKKLAPASIGSFSIGQVWATDGWTIDGWIDFGQPTFFDGTATPTLKHLGLSASGSHVAPPYTGSAALSLKRLAATATGTYTVPRFTGSATVSLKKLAFSLSGTHSAPVYSGTVLAQLKRLLLVASGASAGPGNFAGNAEVTLKKLGAGASGTHTAPVFSGTVALGLQALAASASGSHTLPAFSGTAAFAFRKPSIVAAGAYTVSSKSGAAAVSLRRLGVAAAGTAQRPPDIGAVVFNLRRMRLDGEGLAARRPEQQVITGITIRAADSYSFRIKAQDAVELETIITVEEEQPDDSLVPE